MIKKTLAITDLQFSSSQDTLQKSLQQVPGVQFVSVHLTSQTMDITYDESMITIQQLVDKIETLGYQVSVLDAGKTELLPVHPQKEKFLCRKNILLCVWILNAVSSFFSMVLTMILSLSMVILLLPTIKACTKHMKEWKDETITLLSFILLCILGIAYKDSFTVFSSVSLLALQHFQNRIQHIHTPSFLQDIQKEYVNIYDNHSETVRKVEDIHKSDQIILRPGEIIPADGTVIKGNAYVDESALSGNTDLVRKTEHSYVYANTRIARGSITMQVEELGSTTAMMRFQLTAQKTAQEHSQVSPLSKINTSLGIYMLAGSIVAFISWFCISKEILFSASVATGILCASALHAFSLITKHVVTSHALLASGKHILFCNPAGMQNTSDCDIFFIEQEGAVTQNYLTVTDFICKDGYSSSRLEYIVYALVSRSSKDFSQAITRYLRTKHISHTDMQEFRSLSRTSSRAFSSLGNCISGTPEKFTQEGITIDAWVSKIDALRKQGKKVLLFSENDEVIGLVAASKFLLPHVQENIQTLLQEGKEVHLFCNDPLQDCGHIQALFPEVPMYCQYTQKEKLRVLYSKYTQAKMVAYISQDDPVGLQEAIDVDIRINAGTNVDQPDCDVLLTREDLSDVLEAIHISKDVNTKIRNMQIGVVVYHCAVFVIFALLIPAITTFPVLPLLGKLLSLCTVSFIIHYSRPKN